MKKFFTILCAVALVFSTVNAQPKAQAQLAPKANPVAVKKAEKSVAPVKANTISLTKVSDKASALNKQTKLMFVRKHAFNPAQKFGKKQGSLTPKTNVSTVRRAPAQVEAGTINIVCEGVASVDFFSDGSCQFMGENDDYLVSACYFTTSPNSALGHYVGTAGDNTFDWEYTWIGDYATQQYIYPTAVDINVTMEGNDIVLEGDYTTADGTVYHVVMRNYIPEVEQVVNVDFDEVGVSTDNLADYGIIEFYGENDDYGFDFLISVNDGVVGTYTANDVYYINNSQASIFVSYIEQAILTVVTCTLVIEENGDSYKLTATLLCDNGTEYHFTIAEVPFELTGDEVTLDIPATEVDDSDYDTYGDLYIAGLTETLDYIVALDIYVNEGIAGTYTLDDMSSYSGLASITYNGDGEPIQDVVDLHSATVTVTYDETTGVGDIVGDLIGENGVVYHVSMHFVYVGFQLTGEEFTYDLGVATVDNSDYDTWGDLIFEASNDEAGVSAKFDIRVPETIAGTYTHTMSFLNNANYSYLMVNGEKVKIHEATVTIEYTSPNGTITADIIGSDGNVYHLTMTFEYNNEFVLSGIEHTINFGDATVNDLYYASFGDLIFKGYNADSTYMFRLDIYVNEGIAGQYTEGDLDSFTGLFAIDENGEETRLTIKFAALTITYAEDGTGTISGDITTKDGDVYHITMTFTYAYTEPEPVDPFAYDAEVDFEHSYTTGVIVNDLYLESYGVVIVDAQDAESRTELYFYVAGADENIIITPGTYTINGTHEAGTVQASEGLDEDGYIAASFAGTLASNGYIANAWFITEGTVTVENRDGFIYIEINGKNSKGYNVHITIADDGQAPVIGMEYDTPDADFEHAYASVTEFDRTYLAQYGSIMVTAEDDETMVALDFNLIEGVEDADIVIPAGVYTIDDTFELGTVTASAGVSGTSVYASFAAYLNDLWFLENGTVTVENRNGGLFIEVNATNSYGRTIHVTIGGEGETTAVENIIAPATATKRIIDGHLFIEKDGVLYNAAGMMIK